MQQSIFPGHLHFSSKLYIFKHGTSPGQLHNSIPRDQLAECLPAENTEPGAPGWFSAQGMFRLMFLKSCLNLSAEKHIERFNTDWTLQLFCGKLSEDNQKIKPKAIVSRIRTCIGEQADWQQLQGVLSKHWKPDMDKTHVLLMDAICHESYIRFQGCLLRSAFFSIIRYVA